MKLILAKIEDLEASFSLLPNIFHQRALSFAPGRRNSFLAGRALLFEALKTFYQINEFPQICKNEHGKPFFLDECLPNFNISHTKDMIGLVLSSEVIGIDLEVLRNTKEDLWERFLSENEVNALKGAENKEVLFTRFWTIREAVLKASGEGLSGLHFVKIFPEEKKVKYATLQRGKVLQYFRDDLKLIISLFIPLSDDLEDIFLFKGQQFHKIELADPQIFLVNS